MKLILNNNNKLKKNRQKKRELSNKLKQDLLEIYKLIRLALLYSIDKTIKELAEELGVSKQQLTKKLLTKIENFGLQKTKQTSL
ncbi:hypothetical protein [Enterococcus faecium]|uniref:hypothetical protein n=1 Tax=Enterococcus faecium TaxID=1352 RepID=UPI00349F51B7